VAAGDLDAAIAGLAGELAPRLIADARQEAVAEVRAELTARLSRELLRRCEAELAGAEDRVEEGSAEPPPAPHPLAEHARREATGHYVYGVVAAAAPAVPDLVGVEPSAPVARIENGDLAALVSEVPLAEFDEESLRENLNDVGWLEEKARAHEQVLEATLAAGPVVPLRLCTVFTGADQVRAMLDREHRVLADALARLDGKAEWGVKAFADRDAAEREALRRTDDGSAGAAAGALSAGTAYMNRRRREARAREEVEEIADEWARAIHRRLAGIAAEALLNPLQRPELSGHDGDMILNGVYLIADAEVPAFRAAVEALAEEFDRRGVEVQLTGPWPAYNFVKSSIEAAR
jgi:hypothetical protein